VESLLAGAGIAQGAGQVFLDAAARKEEPRSMFCWEGVELIRSARLRHALGGCSEPRVRVIKSKH